MEHEIVSQLNEAAKILWDGSIRYTVINAWGGVLGWSLFALIVSFGVQQLRKLKTNVDVDKEFSVVVLFIGLVTAGLCYLFCLGGLCESILALIEPIGATVNRLR